MWCRRCKRKVGWGVRMNSNKVFHVCSYCGRKLRVRNRTKK